MATSLKQKIAEIMFDIPTNKISTDDIRWVLSYLPDDTKERGANSPVPLNAVFLHDKEEIHEALGLSHSEVIDLARKLQDSFGEMEGDVKKTKVLEAFYPQLSEKEKVLLIAEGVPSFQAYATTVALEHGGADSIEHILRGKTGSLKRSDLDALASKLELIKQLLRRKRGG